MSNAPAKINLYLHVTGRRDDGYHLLDSLIVFADIGDHITVRPSPEFKFTIDGPYATLLKNLDCAYDEGSTNLVVRAAYALAKVLAKPLDVHIHLSKHIPLGAGLGGGSSDAAATIHALCQYWNIEPDFDTLLPILINLGADVPGCYLGCTARMQGIGEHITPMITFPEIHSVLIYPNCASNTSQVFKNFLQDFTPQMNCPDEFKDFQILIQFLKTTHNDLYHAACKNTPVITEAIEALELQISCVLARMSGSGSACFGIFMSAEAAKKAANAIQKIYPEWWVRYTKLSA